MAWIQIRLNSTNEKAEQISDFFRRNRIRFCDFYG